MTISRDSFESAGVTRALFFCRPEETVYARPACEPPHSGSRMVTCPHGYSCQTRAISLSSASQISATLRTITSLSSVGGLVATVVFVAVGAWNEFLFALMMTTSTGSRTWPGWF